MKKYDLIVIGAGSAGLTAATTGQRKGLSTAMVELNKIGGECTHYGCMPSKAFIHAAKRYHSLGKMKDLGIDVDTPAVDFAQVMEQVDEIVQGIYADEKPAVFKKMGIDVFVGDRAKFTDAHTINVGRETLKGDHFVICTGSSPRILEIDGMEKAKILHNENFWQLREHPRKVVFIGGGVISVELGQALVRLGCEVSILDPNERVLKVTDEEVGGYLIKQLEKEGVEFITEATISKFKDENTLEYCKAGVDMSITADYFFIAAGRLPNIEGMYLEKAGVYFSKKGIATNDFLQTATPHIYACGDVTTPFKYTHTASHQANICISNILNEQKRKNDLSVLPWAIFTEPQIGHVGMTEEQAKGEYGEKGISVFTVEADIDRFITDRNTGGLLKVIFNKKELVVGAEAVGALAGEWIQLLTLVIKNNISAKQMADTIFTYPSYSEIVKKAFTRYLQTKEEPAPKSP